MHGCRVMLAAVVRQKSPVMRLHRPVRPPKVLLNCVLEECKWRKIPLRRAKRLLGSGLGPVAQVEWVGEWPGGGCRWSWPSGGGIS